MKDRKIHLADNFRYLRKGMELNQQQMAIRLRIPFKRYQSYEEGRALPKINSIDQVARFYNFSIEEIVFKDLSK